MRYYKADDIGSVTKYKVDDCCEWTSDNWDYIRVEDIDSLSVFEPDKDMKDKILNYIDWFILRIRYENKNRWTNYEWWFEESVIEKLKNEILNTI